MPVRLPGEGVTSAHASPGAGAGDGAASMAVSAARGDGVASAAPHSVVAWTEAGGASGGGAGGPVDAEANPATVAAAWGGEEGVAAMAVALDASGFGSSASDARSADLWT